MHIVNHSVKGTLVPIKRYAYWLAFFQECDRITTEAVTVLQSRSEHAMFAKPFPELPPIRINWYKNGNSKDCEFVFIPCSRKMDQTHINIYVNHQNSMRETTGCLVHEAIHYYQHMQHPRIFSRLSAQAARTRSNSGYLSNALELEANAFEFAYVHGAQNVYSKAKSTVKLFNSWKKIATSQNLPFAQSIQ